MTDSLVNRVNDHLPVAPALVVVADIVDVAVEIKNPAQRLLRRRNVVALGTEHHDGRSYLTQVDHRAIGSLEPTGSQIVADEKLVNDELDFLGVQIDMAAPPALELEVSFGFGVDLGIDVVLLRPE